MMALTYRFEAAVEISGESILPEIDLVGELCLGNLEGLRSNVDVLEAELVGEVNEGQRNEIAIEALRWEICQPYGDRERTFMGYHTVVAIIDVAGVAIVQPFERTRNVNVEVKVVLVLGLVDSLNVANDVLMDIGGEWLGGLDLVVGGCVKVKDPS